MRKIWRSVGEKFWENVENTLEKDLVKFWKKMDEVLWKIW